MEELHASAKALARAQEKLASFLSRYEEFVSLTRREREPARR
jgi:uncharacterized protein with PIN domain